MLRFTKLDPRATTPRKGTDASAGWDLFPLSEVTLPAKATNFPVPTGVAVDLSTLCGDCPKGQAVYGRVAPRSGYAYRHGVDVLAGVIDRDYRDQIHVILTNPSDAPLTLTPSKAIAQLVLEVHMDNVRWEEVPSLETSERGLGKFGSTDRVA